jgi:RHS repeat-associated protein
LSPNPFTPVSSANFNSQNRLLIQGSQFNQAGDMTGIGGYSLATDAEGRLRTSTLNSVVTSFGYDGEGHRVTKSTAGSPAVVYVYGVGGELMEEYGNAADSAGGTGFLTKDHLGSTRLVTDAAGGAKSCVDYLPFGEELGSWNGRTAGCYSGNAGRVKFTGKERDAETGLDFFEARYLSSAQGRFTSPDPYNIITRAEDREHFNTYLSQPANWNAYVYTWNNPLRYTDPTGETVYVIAYTTGNEGGDEEFKRVAQTRANEIRNSKGFDSKKDTVLVQGIKSFDDLKSLVKQANGLDKTFGKVGELSIVSHAGQDGPNFNYGHNRPGGPHYSNEQNPSGIAGLTVNWDSSARACFLGCRTADRYSDGGFAQSFADRQGVPAYGFPDTSGFSSSPSGRSYWYVFGLGGQNLYMTNRDGRPPVRRDPTKVK